SSAASRPPRKGSITQTGRLCSLRSSVSGPRQYWRRIRCIFLYVSGFFHGSSFPQSRVQDFLPDTQVLRRHLQKLVGIDELQALLQAQDPGRRKLQRFVRAGGTGIGELFGLADVQLDILGFSVLPDDHSGIDLLARPDKERAALLGIEQAV